MPELISKYIYVFQHLNQGWRRCESGNLIFEKILARQKVKYDRSECDDLKYEVEKNLTVINISVQFNEEVQVLKYKMAIDVV